MCGWAEGHVISDWSEFVSVVSSTYFDKLWIVLAEGRFSSAARAHFSLPCVNLKKAQYCVPPSK